MADIDYMRGEIALLMQKADITRVISKKIVYMGFCQSGTTDTSEAKWAICKVEQTADTEPYDIIVKWANGSRQKNLVFDSYNTYTYTFKKF